MSATKGWIYRILVSALDQDNGVEVLLNKLKEPKSFIPLSDARILDPKAGLVKGFLVRQRYTELYDILKTRVRSPEDCMNQPIQVIGGAPGIGKSVFGVYSFLRLCLETLSSLEEGTLLCYSLGDRHETMWISKATEKSSRTGQLSQRQKYIAGELSLHHAFLPFEELRDFIEDEDIVKAIYCVCDPIDASDEDILQKVGGRIASGLLIAIMSPSLETEDTHPLQCNSEVQYMEPWTLDEIKLLLRDTNEIKLVALKYFPKDVKAMIQRQFGIIDDSFGDLNKVWFTEQELNPFLDPETGNTPWKSTEEWNEKLFSTGFQRLLAIDELSSNMLWKRLEYAHEIVGGLLRVLLSDDVFEKTKNYFLKPVKTGSRLDKGLSRYQAWPRRDFVSDIVKAFHFSLWLDDTLRDLTRAVYAVEPYLFEDLVHLIFSQCAEANNRTSDVSCRFSRKSGGQTRQFYLSSWCINTSQFFTKISDIDSLDKGTYYHPRQRNFKAIDSFLYTDKDAFDVRGDKIILFQVTLAKQHNVKLDRLQEVVTEIQAKLDLKESSKKAGNKLEESPEGAGRKRERSSSETEEGTDEKKVAYDKARKRVTFLFVFVLGWRGKVQHEALALPAGPLKTYYMTFLKAGSFEDIRRQK